jgi:hypothetical protein
MWRRYLDIESEDAASSIGRPGGGGAIGENQYGGWYSRGWWYHLILFALRPFAGRSSHLRPALSTTRSQLTSHHAPWMGG